MDTHAANGGAPVNVTTDLAGLCMPIESWISTVASQFPTH
jgi:hypothetical protein